MAYQYQYPNPMQMQGYPQPNYQQHNMNSGIIWVNSEQEALTYMVLPNTAVTLWNSNEPVVYLKQADASGKPSIRTYDLVERKIKHQESVSKASGEFVSMDAFNALKDRLDALETKLTNATE